MEGEDLHPIDDYSHRFFVWHEWIQANGPLTAENVFDYFATSMFYDKQSNNQVLRMQTMHTGVPIANEAEELKRFTGIEFAVVHSEPPSLFVIQKRERLSPEEVRPLTSYFIVNNRIYQSPDVATVLFNRLMTSLHALQTSLDVLRTHRPDFTSTTGFIWPIVDPPPPGASTDKRDTTDNQDGGASERASVAPSIVPYRSQKEHNFIPLFNAMRTTAKHSDQSFKQRSVETLAAAATAPALEAQPSEAPSTAPETPRPDVGAKSSQNNVKKRKKRSPTLPV